MTSARFVVAALLVAGAAVLPVATAATTASAAAAAPSLPRTDTSFCPALFAAPGTSGMRLQQRNYGPDDSEIDNHDGTITFEYRLIDSTYRGVLNYTADVAACTFVDTNGNGSYDAGEPLTGTQTTASFGPATSSSTVAFFDTTAPAVDGDQVCTTAAITLHVSGSPVVNQGPFCEPVRVGGAALPVGSIGGMAVAAAAGGLVVVRQRRRRDRRPSAAG